MSAEKDALPSSFPQDTASCHAMLVGVLQSLAEREKRIGELETIVDTLIQERYGRKSERYDPDQLAFLSQCWHDAHPEYHLEINRSTRLVGDAA